MSNIAISHHENNKIGNTVNESLFSQKLKRINHTQIYLNEFILQKK